MMKPQWDVMCLDPLPNLPQLLNSVSDLTQVHLLSLRDPALYFSSSTFELECLKSWKENRHVMLVLSLNVSLQSGEHLEVLMETVREKYDKATLVIAVYGCSMEDEKEDMVALSCVLSKANFVFSNAKELKGALWEHHNTYRVFESRVKFFHSNKPYFEFSNFYPAAFRLDGQIWKSSEHYYQAHKFLTTDPRLFRAIRKCDTPREAKQMANENARSIRPDWDLSPGANTLPSSTQEVPDIDMGERYPKRPRTVMEEPWGFVMIENDSVSNSGPKYLFYPRFPVEKLKDHIMFTALQAKFHQNDILRLKLLSTGRREIMEESAEDSYWGSIRGRNKMGCLLMYLREILGSGQL